MYYLFLAAMYLQMDKMKGHLYNLTGPFFLHKLHNEGKLLI